MLSSNATTRTDDHRGYLVAMYDGKEVRALANFRTKEHADKFVIMLRVMTDNKFDVGTCICESETAIWTPLDKGLPQPKKREENRIVRP